MHEPVVPAQIAGAGVEAMMARALIISALILIIALTVDRFGATWRP